LTRAWTALISGLAGVDIVLEEPFPLRTGKNQMLGKVENVVERVKRNLKRYWRCF
jgi:hypothetical protein